MAAYFPSPGSLTTTCDDPDTIQYYVNAAHAALVVADPLPSIATSLPLNSTASMSLLCSCVSRGPNFHTCSRGLDVAAPLIRSSLRRLALAWLRDSSKAEADEFAVHLRCGDILQYRHHTEYGFSRYHVYKDVIPSGVGSIGIFSAPTDGVRCRGRDCNHLKTCGALVEDLRRFLADEFKGAIVVVRNGTADDRIVETYARMVLAKGVFCNPSTFCLYPTVASTGVGYLVDSPGLYPWARELPRKSVGEEKGFVLVEEPFLNMRMIVDGGMTAARIIEWLRTPRRG